MITGTILKISQIQEKFFNPPFSSLSCFICLCQLLVLVHEHIWFLYLQNHNIIIYLDVSVHIIPYIFFQKICLTTQLSNLQTMKITLLCNWAQDIFIRSFPLGVGVGGGEP